MTRLLLALVPVAVAFSSADVGTAPPTGSPLVATVEGTVYDSIARAPLSGVTVHFVRVDDPARSHSAITDDEGRFQLRDIASGRYYAAFFPSPLDSLGFESPPREVEVRDDGQRIRLATPSPLTLARTVCGEHVTDSTAVLLGHVRDTRTLDAIVDASVEVEWGEFVIDESGVRPRDRRVETQTAGMGWFAFCNLPGETILTARASRGADSSGYVEVQLAAGGLGHLSFHIGGAALVVDARAGADTGAPDSIAPAGRVWRGGARLSGIVRDGDGRPVDGATVAVWGSGLEVRSNDRGAFTLEGLPGGTQTVEARRIGFEPVRRPVQLSEHDPTTVDLVLTNRAVVLEEVRVRGELVYSRNMLGFARRMRMGARSKFLTPQEIEILPSISLPRMIQHMAGVTVECRINIECGVAMRAGSGLSGPRYCEPSLWIDGRKDIGGMAGMWNFLYSDDIAAVEVYPSAAQVPSEFYDNPWCGAVVVWTRPPAPKVRKPGR